MGNSAEIINEIRVEGSSNDERPNPIVEDVDDQFEEPEAPPIQNIFDNSAFKPTPEFK